MVFIGVQPLPTPPNIPPEWTSTPNPSWVAGTGGTYDLNDDCTDLEQAAISYSLNGGSSALPTGVTLSSAGVLTATSSLAAGTTTGILVDASDGTDTTTSPSFSIVGTETQKVWTPGFYLQLTRGNDYLTQQTRWNVWDTTATNTDVVGVCHNWRWKTFEPGAQGVYDFTELQSDIAHVAAYQDPKQYYVRINDFHYRGNGNTDTTSPSHFPTWIDGTYTYGGTNGVGWFRWESTPMDGYIAMLEALATAVDDDPNFEGIMVYRESTQAFPTSPTPSGYTLAKYETETKRLITALANAFVKSNVVMSLNYVGDKISSNAQVEAWMDSILAHASAAPNGGVGIGGPDVKPTSCSFSSDDHAYNAFIGLTPAATDYRGVIPSIWSTEVSNMAGGVGNCDPEVLLTYADDNLQASHLLITYNNYYPPAEEHFWDPKWLGLIADPTYQLTNTSEPSNYT